MSDLDPSNDYATGLGDGPDREDIEQVLSRFNTTQRDYSADVTFSGRDDYLISVYVGRSVIETFDYLFEFEEMVSNLERAQEAMAESLVAA